MITEMTPREAAIAYLAVEAERGVRVDGLTRIDADCIAEFARTVLDARVHISSVGLPWSRSYTVAASPGRAATDYRARRRLV